MPISRGRKSKPKLPGSIEARRTPSLSKSVPITRRSKKIPSGRLAETLGAIASILVVVGATYDALRGPDIVPDTLPDVSSPFALPFSVENNSFIFPMAKARLFCGIDTVEFSQGTKIANMIVIGDPETTIPQRQTVGFRCPLGDSHGHNIFGVHPPNSHMHRVKYQTLYIPRESEPIEFTWSTKVNPPRWIKGKLADPSAY